MPFLDTLRNALEQLRARAKASVPSHKVGEEEMTVDPALKGVEKELQIALDELKAFKNEDITKPLHAKDLREPREILGHVDSLYHEGKFSVEGVEGIPHGQAKLASMLAEGHELLRECLERVDFYKVAEPLRPLQNKLDNVQHALDTLKDKPDLHPRDLLPLRRKLAEVDNLYHDAKFDVPSPKGKGGKEGGMEGEAGPEGGGIPEGQAVLAASLNTAHETLRTLLFKTDYYKVDEALFSIHDRLESIKMRLESLNQKENIIEKDLVSLRERLQHCDEEWKEGKIEVEGGRVPEGQAVVSKLLYEAHLLMSQVQNKMQG